MERLAPPPHKVSSAFPDRAREQGCYGVAAAMMPYREPLPAVASASTSFPRKNVGVLTALVIALAGAVLVLPTALLVGHAHGAASVFRDGGAGMFALVALSLPIAGVIGLAGALAVRGRDGWAAALVVAPILPGVMGAVLAVLAMRHGLHAPWVGGADVRVLIVTMGLAESDVLPGYGALIAAVACGASACALLASAASVDRTQHRAPAGNAWAGPAAVGGLALIVLISLRVVLHVGFGTLLIAVPSVLILTGLACAATVNAPLVRHWRDPRQADAWIASVVAAAFLAVAAFVLLDLGAALMNEARGLVAISGEALDPSQRARILASVAGEQGSYRVLAIVDGIFGFLTVAVAALAGLGRAADGRLRFPRGPTLYGALGASVLVVASLVGAHAWMLGSVEKATAGTASTIELPRVPVTERLSAPSYDGPVLHVDANGKSTLDAVGRPSSFAPSAVQVLVVDADRRARWADVAVAIRDARRSLWTTSIELRVTLLDKADRSQLGPYGPLLGDETSALRIGLALPSRVGSDGAADDDLGARGAIARGVMRPHDFELMDGIAAAIARRSVTFGLRARSTPDVALLPPEGTW